MMVEWDRRYPGRSESVFNAMQHLVPSHLADTAAFDFCGLRAGERENQGNPTAHLL